MSDRFVLQGDLVLDRDTGLTWQREASVDRMVWKDGFAYVERINNDQFAGFNDWRYPTRDELATLILTDENRETGLYVDSLFGKQRNCWTSTEAGHHKALYVDFYYGEIYKIEENYANHFIRAVRTQKG